MNEQLDATSAPQLVEQFQQLEQVADVTMKILTDSELLYVGGGSGTVIF